MVILKNRIIHNSGEVKTVCVTACLTSFGVPLKSFHYTGTVKDSRRENILRKFGYAVRSRFSKLPKNPTIGKARKVIQNLNDSSNTRYLITLQGSGYCHCVVLDKTGKTIVDTSPRKRDKRKIISIKAVY